MEHRFRLNEEQPYWLRETRGESNARATPSVSREWDTNPQESETVDMQSSGPASTEPAEVESSGPAPTGPAADGDRLLAGDNEDIGEDEEEKGEVDA